ncbi:MAG: hypothetical protein IT293_08095 [Deltaproteobacteria bacterium]|nr:hypothetical protein [Deltaproteobacteria bacterium]
MHPTVLPPRTPRRLRLALATLSLCAAGCLTREPAFEKTTLTRLPATYKDGSILVADDGRTFAFVDQTPAGERVVTRDGAGEPHTRCPRVAFAPRTHRLFYWTVDEAEGTQRVGIVADGRAIPTEAVAAGAFAFADDGGHWGAIGVSGTTSGEVGDFTLFLDGRDAGRWRDVGLPAFRPDGRVAWLGADAEGVRLFVDGRPVRTFEPPTAPCARAAMERATRPDLPARHTLRWLAGGALLLLTRDRDGWSVYRDETRLAAYDINRAELVDEACRFGTVIAPGSLRAAEDAATIVWWERAAGDSEHARLWRIAKDGGPLDDLTCSEPWSRQAPEISADGMHTAYACRLRDEANLTTSFVVHDGKRYGPYQEIWGVALSRDGTHVTYGATLGGAPTPRPWAIYVDGTVRAAAFSATWRPRVSDDGATVAWQAQRVEGGRGTLGIGAHRVGTFDEVLWGPEFETANGRPRIAWVIRRGRALTRVSVAPPARR